VGDYKTAYSSDGINWTAVKCERYIQAIAWGNNKFVAGVGGGIVYWSGD